MTPEERPVLIVDDDVDIREALSDVLEDRGFAVVTAANGLDALRLIRSMALPPSVILLDLMMPIMDGWQFRAAQLADPDLGPIPVVVLSAVNDGERVSAGAYLRKPVQLKTLLDAVNRFCQPAAAAG